MTDRERLDQEQLSRYDWLREKTTTRTEGEREMKLTIEKLRELGACEEGIDAFQSQRERDAVALLKECLKQEKLEWANWLVVRLLDRQNKIQYALFAAEQVLELFEKQYPKNDRPRKAIEAAKTVLANDTEENRNAAYAAANAASAYAASAYAAASAAYAAAYAAYASAYAAAYATYAYAAAAAAYTYAVYDIEIKTKIIVHGIELLKSQPEPKEK